MIDCKSIIGTFDNSLEPAKGIRRLDPDERFQVALKALDHSRSVTEVAAEKGVSRKCVYQQKERAIAALEEAFRPESLTPDSWGWQSVTTQLLKREIVSCALNLHGSLRGTCEHIKAVHGVQLSEGFVFNVLHEAARRAKAINETQDLSRIREGAHDEIFSQRTPVLVGVEPRTYYTYLLEAASHRDEVSWWVALTEKKERQGLNLQRIVSDAARGLQAGALEAFAGVELRGDILHAQMGMGELGRYLENRAYSRLGQLEYEERKMSRAKKQSEGNRRSKGLAWARTRAEDAVTLYDEMRLLIQWVIELFALVGPPLAERQKLYDWLVGEMEAREKGSHRIPPIVHYLKRHRDELLAFVPDVQQGLARIAGTFHVPSALVEAVYERRPMTGNVPPELPEIQGAVAEMLEDILRASSAVENINSILRGYFFLRRSLGDNFLHLLQFYLNHRRFRRSECPERSGKSPWELMSGQSHPDWLDLLGYPPVKCSN